MTNDNTDHSNESNRTTLNDNLPGDNNLSFYVK